ncbi:MAG TPA: hypothetical protein VG097_10700 [Gemmata sp.]|nr:hypothetical protein [Gemmata sp.]
MSTAPTPPSSPLPPLAPPQRKEITLISHSMLFYWWPIWVLGYVMALITYFDNERLAIIPPDAKLTQVEKDEKTTVYRLAVTKPTHSLAEAAKATETPGEGSIFRARISERPWMGPIFCVVLLVTVVITNVPLRGLWSFLVILLIIVLVLLVSIMKGWDSLLAAIFHLHIHINMAGYLFIASAVLFLWLISVFIFDQRTYMTVEPGQIRLCEHVGASIRNIPAAGVEFEKQRDDLFRHWLLGFFSGDLIIHLADKQQIRLPNVLWISWRLEEVQQLLREIQVTTGK